MKELSKVALSVHASTTLAVDSLAKKMKAAGEDVVSFGTGEPDFETPAHIREAAIAAMNAGHTKYTPAAGLPALRQAVADRLQADFCLEYDASQIVVASGAKHNVFITLMALLDPGDEVVVPAPYWVTYCEAIAMAGGVAVAVPAAEGNDFKISADDLDAAITDRTKAVIINNPSNPTGTLYLKDELKALADVCVRRDIYIIADEIYSGLVYDGLEFTSIPTLGEEIKERTILITGVSKSYAMTGWRVGYSASNQQIAKVMSNYLSHSTGAPSTISQYAAIEALTASQESIREMHDVFEERRNYIVRRVNEIEGVSCIKPEGAFYIMMNIKKLIGRTLGGRLINDGDDFAMAFLETKKVAVVPCSGFGAKDFVRWTYAASMEDIAKGLDRLEEFLR